jgi:hypothetical protein
MAFCLAVAPMDDIPSKNTLTKKAFWREFSRINAVFVARHWQDANATLPYRFERDFPSASRAQRSTVAARRERILVHLKFGRLREIERRIQR